VTAVDSPVPPALGIWHRESPQYPGGNYTKAWEILQADGFCVQNATLVQPNGVPVRNQIDLLSMLPLTANAILTELVDQWNDFFDNYVGVTNCNLWLDIIDGQTFIQRVWFVRNFDLYFNCWGLARFPDYLYDLFHSAMEGVDGNNAPGLKDPELDALLETIKHSMDYEEKLQACYEAQDKLVFEDCPCVYFYSLTYRHAFKNYTYYTGEPKWLTSMVNQKVVGADGPWTWGLMHWNMAPTGGTVKSVLTGNLANLHPGWATSAYDWDVLNRIEDGLLATDLEMADLPWIAADWSFEPFTCEPLGINCTRVRFQIREGVKWHDLKPVTMEDIEFALNYSQNFPRFQSAWRSLLWTQIVDSHTIDVYTNTTSYWTLYDLASMATMFPKHIYDKPGSVSAKLWSITYQEWTGQPPPPQYPFMKALIGCGPYVFDYWNSTAGTVHLVKFQDYWVNKPLRFALVAPERVLPDTPFEYKADLINTGSIDTVTGEIISAVINHVEVYVDGNLASVVSGPISVDSFANLKLGFNAENGLSKGLHLLSCKLYAYGSLYEECEQRIWATIKEDINADLAVGVDDIFAAALVFGSQPLPPQSYRRWDERCDVNNDYYVGIDDIFQIATKFGWDP
jgi:ABC-type transport system substrate-binding protein